MNEKIPEPVTAEQKWIVGNRVVAIRVEYRQTGVDTADTYVHLESREGKKACWRDTTFKELARLSLGYLTICEPAHGLREKVEARCRWEQNNAAELATYKRLKAKYEGADEPIPYCVTPAGRKALCDGK